MYTLWAHFFAAIIFCIGTCWMLSSRKYVVIGKVNSKWVTRLTLRWISLMRWLARFKRVVPYLLSFSADYALQFYVSAGSEQCRKLQAKVRYVVAKAIILNPSSLCWIFYSAVSHQYSFSLDLKFLIKTNVFGIISYKEMTVVGWFLIEGQKEGRVPGCGLTSFREWGKYRWGTSSH